MRSIPLAVLCVTISMSSSCSLLILRSGTKDLARYNAREKTFTRARVIEHLGQPTSTETFSKPRTFDSLAGRYPTLRLPTNDAGKTSSGAILVAIVDTYQFTGYVVDEREYEAAGESSIFTYGIGEVVNVPLAISERVSGSDDQQTFRIAYSPSGVMVAHRLDSKNVTVRKKR